MVIRPSISGDFVLGQALDQGDIHDSVAVLPLD
jgi:hypothetical protein